MPHQATRGPYVPHLLLVLHRCGLFRRERDPGLAVLGAHIHLALSTYTTWESLDPLSAIREEDFPKWLLSDLGSGTQVCTVALRSSGTLVGCVSPENLWLFIYKMWRLLTTTSGGGVGSYDIKQVQTPVQSFPGSDAWLRSS